MKKKEREKQAIVSHYTISKMYHGENVTIDILERIANTDAQAPAARHKAPHKTEVSPTI